MPAPTDGRRTKRVAELIQRHFAEVLRREVDDPRFAAVVVTGIDVSDDLMIANIGVRLLVADDDERQRRDIVKRLRRAAPRLRRAITPRLELKRAPELRFHYDVGPDAHQRVAALLREVEAERKSVDDAPSDPEPEVE